MLETEQKNDVNAKSYTVFPEYVWMVIHTMVSELRYISNYSGVCHLNFPGAHEQDDLSSDPGTYVKADAAAHACDPSIGV